MELTVCAACFGNDFRENDLIPEVVIKECLTCGLLASNVKRAGPALEEFARVNKDLYHRAVSNVRRQQASKAISLVQKHDGRKGLWLDIGCSFGYLLEQARHSGFSVFGVEPDAEASQHARKLIGEECVHHGTMSDEITLDASADVISMMDVLEHIPADRLPAFADMIHKKLRPKGLWLIKVPSTEGLYFNVAHRLLKFGRPLLSNTIKRLWQSEYEFPHTVYFNRRTLERYLQNHGFEVVDFTYLADVPNRTVIDRLLMDNTIPRWQAYFAAPVFYLINLIEKCRGKSDALLMLARR